ncbi:helix-turn-helix transcriptional regulator [Pseudobacillus sp. FSL P4-0506]|uniref:helix-turn-helix domain-containing protein n=1 Tax=Pseudobacillus sp. FSL P4-0506 TaxID=2921576 RepID=UPI0030F716EC
MLIVKPKLNFILKNRGITQMKLAEMSGVPQGSISRFDKNNRHEAAHLFAISRALNLPIEDLFEVTEEEE